MECKANAIILAGGKNSRMEGQDKAFLEIEGRPIIERIFERLKNLVNEIIVVTNSPEKYHCYPVKLVSDEKPGLGPLMGIYCGLKASSARYNFVAACDMPFINSSLIKYMLENSGGYDIFIPKARKRFHPLFGVYSQSCIPAIESMLKKDELRISSIFPKLNVRFLLKREIERIDPGQRSLININTPLELKGIRWKIS